MSTLTMSKTWQHRVRRGRRLARTAGIVAVVVCAVIGFAAGVKVFLLPHHPDATDVAAIASRVGNQRDAAGQFAADFVAAFLTTPSTKQAALQRFITLPQSETVPQAAQSAPPPPAVINTPKVWSVVAKGSAGATRAFYRVPVAIWQYQPRAMDWPVPISDPGPGADVKMSYGHALSPSSPVFGVVSGFISTYLTATAGLDRYVVADSWIKAIGGYQSAIIKTAETDAEVPETPANGTQIHVRTTVVAQTSQFATVNFTFPLTVENSGGTWMIADIDLIPQISNDTDSVPADGTHS
jgi:Conjugative transposon protein TcpC